MTQYYRHTILEENEMQRPVTVPISMAETLTLRDQFAMAALTAVIARYGSLSTLAIAEDAYQVADAMLEARKEKK